ncbi:transglutaminase domain-containing protein [Chryseolinea sp. T2]|uniref:transglutaminase domain-containing protein n=1 Tax=Chryseolinea sp. T2 TaxID=3129255 RepID=UPI0030780645
MLYTLSRYTLSLIIVLLSFVSASGQVSDFVNLDLHSADSVANCYKGHPLDNFVTLSHKLTRPFSTDVEKFRAIYTWVCENIEGDPVLFEQNQRQRKKLHARPEELKEWSVEFSRKAFKILMKDKRAVCTGYAYVIRELSLHAGLSCKTVDGYGRTVASNIGGSGVINHSWNMVQLNGKWYLCDATWSSGATDSQSKQFIRRYDPSYFLAQPDLFIRNHYPQDSTLTLLSNPPTLHEFLNGPIIYVTAFRFDMRPKFGVSMDTTVSKGEDVTFEFAGSGLLSCEKMALKVDNSSIASRTTTFACGSETLYSTVVRFTSKGIHYVHFLGDAGPLYTYRVTVK